MSIIIGADIVPIESNRYLFENASVKELIGEELEAVLREADYRIFNLETPLTDMATPIEKHGRNLIASTKSVKGIKALGTDLVALANNHIMDQGVPGLQSTFRTLKEENINYFGAGSNLQEAQRPYYFTSEGKKYGIYACAEHEFSIAGENHPGANPFDPLESLDHVADMKAKCDYAIVLYHGGKEQYRYPSPNLQKICRKLVDKGANLVICQHSHCIGCKEEYKSGTIVYGQGNFLFTQWDNEYWNTGLLIRLQDGGDIEFLPVVKNKEGIKLADKEERKTILQSYEMRSREIQEPETLDKLYSEYVAYNSSGYLLLLSGREKNIVYRIANKLSRGKLQKTIVKRYKRRVRMPLRNYIECETHREIILRELENE